METQPENIKRIVNIPLWIFGITWLLGTLILLFYITEREEYLMILGVFYTLTATALNGIALTVFITLSYVYKPYRQEILLRAALLLLNIPIAALYAFLALSNFFK